MISSLFVLDLWPYTVLEFISSVAFSIFCRVKSVLHTVLSWCVMKFSPFLCLSSLSFKLFRDDENMISAGREFHWFTTHKLKICMPQCFNES